MLMGVAVQERNGLRPNELSKRHSNKMAMALDCEQKNIKAGDVVKVMYVCLSFPVFSFALPSFLSSDLLFLLPCLLHNLNLNLEHIYLN